MNINQQINALSFNGLWEHVGTIKKESGSNNINKVFYTLHDFIYHPFSEESTEEIARNVKKQYFGRSFSLWDKFDNQCKCDIFQMNRIKVGDVINKTNENEYIKKGWQREPLGVIVNDNDFYKIYDNPAYAPMGLERMSSEYVDKIAIEHFDKKA